MKGKLQLFLVFKNVVNLKLLVSSEHIQRLHKVSSKSNIYKSIYSIAFPNMWV